jgi:peptide/nickel transport system substrate-binding protein
MVDGEEYQLPFVDKVVQPLIVDPLSQLAALRTGQVDWHTSVKLQYEEEFDRTNPGMLKYKYLLANLRLVGWKSTPESRFDSRELRRAMMVGTDIDTIIENVFMEGEKHVFPFNENSPQVFTPMDQMPASVQELFDYDPDQAKRMLADAGYPDGLEIELVIRTDPDFRDIGELLASQWAKFGVKTSLKTLEVTLHDNMRGTHDYKDGFLWETGASIIPGHASVGLFFEGRRYNMADYNNPTYNEMYLAAEAEMDQDKQNDMVRELSIMLLDDAPYLPLGSPYQISMTWPWVQNYYGEVETGFINYEPMINRIWIDQVMKKDMGY